MGQDEAEQFQGTKRGENSFPNEREGEERGDKKGSELIRGKPKGTQEENPARETVVKRCRGIKTPRENNTGGKGPLYKKKKRFQGKQCERSKTPTNRPFQMERKGAGKLKNRSTKESREGKELRREGYRLGKPKGKWGRKEKSGKTNCKTKTRKRRERALQRLGLRVSNEGQRRGGQEDGSKGG